MTSHFANLNVVLILKIAYEKQVIINCIIYAVRR